MSRAQRNIIWHWKLFDLAVPLAQLDSQGIARGSVSGLVTADTFGGPEERGVSFLGIPRMSAARLRFYRDSLALLERQYRRQGLELQRDERSAAACLAESGDRQDALTVWYPPHLGSEETTHIETIRKALPATVALRPLPANTLLREEELPFPLASLPDTFSRFRRKIEKRGYRSYQFSSLPARLDPADSPGRQRIEEYIFRKRRILTYKKTRNGLGPGDYSSRLSRYLAAGTISAAEVGAAILLFERSEQKNESTYWLLFELLWRDYFHFLHRRAGAATFAPRGLQGKRSPGLRDSIAWTFSGSNQAMRFPRRHRPLLESYWQRFRDWVLGRTGEPFVDTMMGELYHTGDLSNRGRQCAASYLIHDLNLPWWWGAQWFEHALLDYDVSSNWGNWAYIAGVGADPRPVRKFNLRLQAERYDPDGRYRRWGEEQNWDTPADAVPAEFPGTFC